MRQVIKKSVEGTTMRLLAPLAAVLLIAACAAPAAPAAPAASSAAEGTAAAGEKIIIGALHVGAINDAGYNQAQHDGLAAMAKAMP